MILATSMPKGKAIILRLNIHGSSTVKAVLWTWRFVVKRLKSASVQTRWSTRSSSATLWTKFLRQSNPHKQGTMSIHFCPQSYSNPVSGLPPFWDRSTAWFHICLIYAIIWKKKYSKTSTERLRKFMRDSRWLWARKYNWSMKSQRLSAGLWTWLGRKMKRKLSILSTKHKW